MTAKEMDPDAARGRLFMVTVDGHHSDTRCLCLVRASDQAEAIRMALPRVTPAQMAKCHISAWADEVKDVGRGRMWAAEVAGTRCPAGLPSRPWSARRANPFRLT